MGRPIVRLAMGVVMVTLVLLPSSFVSCAAELPEPGTGLSDSSHGHR